jgi:hypothetical protein
MSVSRLTGAARVPAHAAVKVTVPRAALLYPEGYQEPDRREKPSAFLLSREKAYGWLLRGGNRPCRSIRSADEWRCAVCGLDVRLGSVAIALLRQHGQRVRPARRPEWLPEAPFLAWHFKEAMPLSQHRERQSPGPV